MNADQNLWTITASPLTGTTKLFPLRFPLAGVRRLGQNLPLVDAVERRAQLDAGAGANHVAAGLLEERELLGARIERDEVGLHRALALVEDLARDVFRRAPAGVLAVGEDEHVLAEHARAVEVGARLVHRFADGGAAARPRQRGERAADRAAIVRLDLAQ